MALARAEYAAMFGRKRTYCTAQPTPHPFFASAARACRVNNQFGIRSSEPIFVRASVSSREKVRIVLRRRVLPHDRRAVDSGALPERNNVHDVAVIDSDAAIVTCEARRQRTDEPLRFKIRCGSSQVNAVRRSHEQPRSGPPRSPSIRSWLAEDARRPRIPGSVASTSCSSPAIRASLTSNPDASTACRAGHFVRAIRH